MDDIEILREVRRRPADPSPAAHAAARAALLQRATAPTVVPERGRRFRLPRGGVRLVAASLGLSAAAAGAVVFASGTTPSPTSHPLLIRLSAAQQVLYHAANNAQAQAFTAPRSDQWIYIESLNRSPGKPGPGQVQTAQTPLQTRIDRTWTRADGKQVAFLQNGKLIISPTGGATPPSDYASLAALPHDPQELLTWAREQAASAPKKQARDTSAFAILDSILYAGLVPPQQQATIYRTLAKIPGVTLDKDATDTAGRPALGVAYTIGWMNEEILFDPGSYAYRGQRSVAIKDHTESVSDQKITGKDGTVQVVKGGTWTVKKGAIDLLTARTAAGIVDNPGQRP